MQYNINKVIRLLAMHVACVIIQATDCLYATNVCMRAQYNATKMHAEVVDIL